MTFKLVACLYTEQIFNRLTFPLLISILMYAYSLQGTIDSMRGKASF